MRLQPVTIDGGPHDAHEGPVVELRPLLAGKQIADDASEERQVPIQELRNVDLRGTDIEVEVENFKETDAESDVLQGSQE